MAFESDCGWDVAAGSVDSFKLAASVKKNQGENE